MTRFERWSVWATSLLTFFSGAGYFWTKYLLRTDDLWAAVNHPLEPWFLRVHVVVAPLLVFAVGLIALRHVWRHFRTRTPHGYRTGILLAAMVGPMVLTGYLIQVVTDLGWLRALVAAHVVTGALFFLGLAAHQWSLRGVNGERAERSLRWRRRRRGFDAAAETARAHEEEEGAAAAGRRSF